VGIANAVYKDYHIYSKATFNFSMMNSFLGSENLVFSNGEEWKNQRTVITPIFGRISMFQKPMTAKIGEFIDGIERALNDGQKSICIGEDIQKMTLDVLGATILGEDYQFLKGREDGPLFWYKEILGNIMQHPFVTMSYFSWIPFKKAVETRNDIKKFDQHLKSLIDNPSKPKNCLLYMLCEALNNNTMEYDVVRNNLVIFFLAGHETTSVSLQFCLYNLAKDLQYQSKLREMIFENFPNEDLDYETLKDFNVVANIVNESLRMFPPVPNLPGRKITEDTQLEGWFIPKGFQINISIYRIHHNKEIWGEDAYEFNPDRFDRLTPIQKKAFMPFGGGARVCLGMAFSLLEQKIFLIKLLKRYEITMDPESVLEVSPFLFNPNAEKFKLVFNRLEAQ